MIKQTEDSFGSRGSSGFSRMRAHLEHEATIERANELERALIDLYDYMPRGMCKSDRPDGCPVCVAKRVLGK